LGKKRAQKKVGVGIERAGENGESDPFYGKKNRALRGEAAKEEGSTVSGETDRGEDLMVKTSIGVGEKSPTSLSKELGNKDR